MWELLRARVHCRYNSLDEVRRLERHEGVELIVEESDRVLLELVGGGKLSFRQHFLGDILVPAPFRQPRRIHTASEVEISDRKPTWRL